MTMVFNTQGVHKQEPSTGFIKDLLRQVIDHGPAIEMIVGWGYHPYGATFVLSTAALSWNSSWPSQADCVMVLIV